MCAGLVHLTNGLAWAAQAISYKVSDVSAQHGDRFIHEWYWSGCILFLLFGDEKIQGMV